MRPLLSLLTAIILAVFRTVGAAQANPVSLTYDRAGGLRWTLPFSNGQIAIVGGSNMASLWMPYQAFAVSSSTGGVVLSLTNQFYQVFASAAESRPPVMHLVPGGHFLMGDDNTFTYANEKPRHPVYVSAFLIDRFEVTNEQMREMMQWAFSLGRVTVNNSKMVSSAWSPAQPLLQCKGVPDSIVHNQVTFTNGAFGVEEGTTNNPCVGISWYGALAFCNWRSEREGLEPCYDLTNWTCNFSLNGYRLPTEAEWEKAARGGQTGHNFPWTSVMGNNNNYPNQISTNQATFTPIGLPHPFRTSPVGYYNGTQVPAGPDTANGYGLYDVIGNVREWCWDWFSASWYANPEARAPDPTGPSSGDLVTLTTGAMGPTRVSRGGSFDENQKNVRCAFRGEAYQSSPSFAHWYHGMRCVRR